MTLQTFDKASDKEVPMPSIHAVVFCLLLKKIIGNPYLKILDFSQLCVTYEEQKSKGLVLPPLRGLLFLVSKIAHEGEG